MSAGSFLFSLFAEGTSQVTTWNLESTSDHMSSFEKFQSYAQAYLKVAIRFKLILVDGVDNYAMIIKEESKFQAMKKEAEGQFKWYPNSVVKLQIQCDYDVQLFEFSLQTAQDPTPLRHWSLHYSSAPVSSFKSLQAYFQANMKNSKECYLVVHSSKTTTLFVKNEVDFQTMLDLAVIQWATRPEVPFKAVVLAETGPVPRCGLCCGESPVPEDHYETCRALWVRAMDEDKKEVVDSYYFPGARVYVTREFDRRPAVKGGFIVRTAPNDTFCVKLRSGEILPSVLRQSLSREKLDICDTCVRGLIPGNPFQSHYQICRSRVIEKSRSKLAAHVSDPFRSGARVFTVKHGEGFIVRAEDKWHSVFSIQLSDGAFWLNVPKEDLVLIKDAPHKDNPFCNMCVGNLSTALPFSAHYNDCRLRMMEKALATAKATGNFGFIQGTGFTVGTRIVFKELGEEGFIAKHANFGSNSFVVQLCRGEWIENIPKEMLVEMSAAPEKASFSAKEAVNLGGSDVAEVKNKVNEVLAHFQKIVSNEVIAIPKKNEEPVAAEDKVSDAPYKPAVCSHCTKLGYYTCAVCVDVNKPVCEAKSCQEKHYEDCRAACIAANAEKIQIQGDQLKIGKTVWMQDETRSKEYIDGFVVAYDEASAKFAVKFRVYAPVVHAQLDRKILKTDYRPVKEMPRALFENASSYNLSEKMIAILKSIFAEFSSEGIVQYRENDVIVRKRARFTNLEHYCAYIKKITQGSVHPVEGLQQFYYDNVHAMTVDYQPALLEEDFIAIYKKVAQNRSTEYIVWKVLFTLGYDGNLNPVPANQLFSTGELVEYYIGDCVQQAVVLESNVVAESTRMEIVVLADGRKVSCFPANIRKDYTICKKCREQLNRVSLHSFTCCELCEMPRPACMPVQYICIRL